MLRRALHFAPPMLALCACAAQPAHPDRPEGHASPALASGSASSRPSTGAAPPPAAAHVSELESVTQDEADPKARELFREKMAQAAVSLVASTAPQGVTARALDDTRRGEAPGMKADGTIFAATLTEGQRATLPVKMTPGECVTYVAQGGLGVIEVDLFLTVGDGAAARILAEDPSTGPIGVIGGRGQCFSSPSPVDGVLHAAARRGAGLVLVRAFRR